MSGHGHNRDRHSPEENIYRFKRGKHGQQNNWCPQKIKIKYINVIGRIIT